MLRVRTVFGGVQGTPWYSNLYFRGTEDTDAIEAHAAVDDFWTALATVICTPVTWTIEGEVAVLDTVTGQPVATHQVPPETGAGSASGVARVPTALQILVRLGTGVFLNGRRVRGRIFIPGSGEGNWENGLLTPSTVTAVNSAVGLLLNNTPTNEFVVWSRRNGQMHNVISREVWTSGAVLRSRRD